MLQCQMEQTGRWLTVYLTGEIDHHGAGQVRACIDSRILEVGPERVILDLSGVGFMDSSGIGLILGRRRLLQTLGADLTVRGVGGQVASLLRIAGIQSEEKTGGAHHES